MAGIYVFVSVAHVTNSKGKVIDLNDRKKCLINLHDKHIIGLFDYRHSFDFLHVLQHSCGRVINVNDGNKSD